MDRELLEAALIGYRVRVDGINAAIETLRQRLLNDNTALIFAPAKNHRKLSSGARKRIAAGQRKRWAQYRKEHAK